MIFDEKVVDGIQTHNTLCYRQVLYQLSYQGSSAGWILECLRVLCSYWTNEHTADIRIPLEWQEFESTQGKVDSHAQFGVFCLFRIGNQVMDTPSLVQVDRSTVDITFKDTILL